MIRFFLSFFMIVSFYHCDTSAPHPINFTYGWINNTETEIVILFGDSYRIAPNNTNSGLQGDFNTGLFTNDPVTLEFRSNPNQCLVYSGETVDSTHLNQATEEACIE